MSKRCKLVGLSLYLSRIVWINSKVKINVFSAHIKKVAYQKKVNTNGIEFQYRVVSKNSLISKNLEVSWAKMAIVFFASNSKIIDSETIIFPFSGKILAAFIFIVKE